MKTLISRFFLIALLFAAFSGCEIHTADAPQKNSTEIETLTIAQMIGQQHNAGLDYILKRMKERSDPFRNRKEATAFFRNAVEDYIMGTTGADLTQITEKVSLDRIFSVDEEDGAGKKRTGAENMFENSELDMRSPPVRHLTALFDIYRQNAGRNFFDYNPLPEVRSANRKLDSSFSREEMLLIQGVSETMSASFDYWGKNRVDWLSEFTRLAPRGSNHNSGDGSVPKIAFDCYTPLPVPCAMIDWDRVIIQDGGGLVDGVVYNTLYWLAFGPPGWVTGGVILGAGAAGASAQDLYLQIVSYL